MLCVQNRFRPMKITTSKNWRSISLCSYFWTLAQCVLKDAPLLCIVFKEQRKKGSNHIRFF